MMGNRRTFLYFALGCGLAIMPATGLRAQSGDQSTQAQPSGQDQEIDPLKRPRSDKEKVQAQKAVRQELKGAYKILARPGCCLHYFGGRAESFQEPEQR